MRNIKSLSLNICECEVMEREKKDLKVWFNGIECVSKWLKRKVGSGNKVSWK